MFCDGGPCAIALTVVKRGQATGSVRFVDGGVACAQGSCTLFVDAGTRLSLLATPTSGGLERWSAGGPCTSPEDPLCTFVVVEPASQTVTFSPFNVVFVSSVTVAPGAIGGLDGGDGLCTSLARDAGLSGTFRAWLSTNTSAAPDRVLPARGFIRPDGRPFVDRLTGALATLSGLPGRTAYPLSVTEHGVDLINAATLGGERVVTGTSDRGAPTGGDCNEWRSTTAGDAVQVGSATGGHALWTSWYGGLSCSQPARLYCFGVDYVTVLPPLASVGRIAFVSAEPFRPGSGLAGADAHCRGEALDAGLSGSFRAALATRDAGFASRFTASGPWVRTDGVAFVEDAGAFLAGAARPLAPLSVDARRRPNWTAGVWTGHNEPTAPFMATCADWTNGTSTFVNGATGNAGEAREWLSTNTADTCTSSRSLYCLQE